MTGRGDTLSMGRCPLWWLPAQHRFAGGCGLVQAAQRRLVRSVTQQLRLLLRLPRYRQHRLAEGVQRLLPLRLRRLDHQRLVDDEREVDRWWVEAVVDEPLGDVERLHHLRALADAGEDDLVHAGAVVGEVVGVAEAGLDVVGVDDGVLADGAQPLRSERADVGEGADEDAEVAVEGDRPADAALRRHEAVEPTRLLRSPFDRLRTSGKGRLLHYRRWQV